jgi:hypothetical protein
MWSQVPRAACLYLSQLYAHQTTATGGNYYCCQSMVMAARCTQYKHPPNVQACCTLTTLTMLVGSEHCMQLQIKKSLLSLAPTDVPAHEFIIADV